ncbi:DUF5361 domain-containing protein [Prescottella agglutinans]|uniref:Uncharacterized protein n=1 Tax=Prescottella agglutinans TaxID=1644129 RepID=A0ABT6MFY1_9NOCA|nr:DUF5361 domain-containing protein [Prescottella agglutinans]MDH6283231.1 hypothetical protein [Prescottella agglutinans]
MNLDLEDLGTDLLTWRKAIVIVRELANDPNSALVRAADPDHLWDFHAHLLAGLTDSVNLLVWIQGGGKNGNKPKPLPRPGVTVREDEQVIGEATDIDEVDSLIGW